MTREEAYGTLKLAISRLGDEQLSRHADEALEFLLASSPALCGAAEAGEILGMAATNVKRLSPPLRVVERLKMGPVYYLSDVLAAKARREGQS